MFSSVSFIRYEIDYIIHIHELESIVPLICALAQVIEIFVKLVLDCVWKRNILAIVSLMNFQNHDQDANAY